VSKPTISFIMKNYDYLAPFAAGDVVAEDIELKLDRFTSMLQVVDDPAVDGGELSFSAHLIRLANGDRSFVGIPFFATRLFRHRCFFVRRDSGLKSFKELAGKRIGTNAWPDSGNTWSRSLLRAEGVQIDQIQWWVGAVDDPTYDAFHGRAQYDLPYVHAAEPGRVLVDMLLEGELDALMCPVPPKGFRDVLSPIVRLIQDYPRAEAEYYRKTGICPTQHILGLRRAVFERAPWVARSIYQTLEKSKAQWQAGRRRLTDTTPWLLAEIEKATEMMGEDWSPNGVEANFKAISCLCEEELAQGLIAEPLDPNTVFAEFQEVMKG
jgi:4,5-dihydroxyphthalate decarboxylase